MKFPDIAEALELGADLERIGAKMASGETPEIADVIGVLTSALVAFTDDIDELRPHLIEASRIRQDFLVDLAARAQLGPRPR